MQVRLEAFLRGVADLLELTAQGKIHAGHSDKLYAAAQAARNLLVEMNEEQERLKKLAENL